MWERETQWSSCTATRLPHSSGAEPRSIMDVSMIDWAEQNLMTLSVQPCGEGVHFVQEGKPAEIGTPIADWMFQRADA
jgi:hypothetical protein